MFILFYLYSRHKSQVSNNIEYRNKKIVFRFFFSLWLPPPHLLDPPQSANNQSGKSSPTMSPSFQYLQNKKIAMIVTSEWCQDKLILDQKFSFFSLDLYLPISGGKSILNRSALVKTSFNTPFHFLLMLPTCWSVLRSTILKMMSLLAQQWQQALKQLHREVGPSTTNTSSSLLFLMM